MSEEMRQPTELQFLEMVRALPSALPPRLADYQSEPFAEDLHNYRKFMASPIEPSQSLALSDATLAVLFHHIAFETFSALERVKLEVDGDGGDDDGFPEIQSPVVRKFWKRFVEQRTASRTARAKEILDELTEEDRRALRQAGVQFPSVKSRRPRAVSGHPSLQQTRPNY